ncbi:MAG TPA: 2-deoxyribose-5-phosphate aldolase, partial [Verrucomicrobiae bacterium]|nr:2-deoxyribose-5-phosphate aldolase [Verrucomicrobiae bacterium]
MSKNDINPLAPVTDLIFLKPGATRAELEAICAGARRAGIRAVCVAGSHVSLARHFLEDSEVKVIGTAGFPWGATDSDVKRYETEAAVDADAHEIEAVIHLGWLRDGDHAAIERELRDL